MMHGVDREASSESESQRRTVSMPSWVLGSALAFFSGVRSRNSVCRSLHGKDPLPRSGGLVSRSPSCVNNAGSKSRS